MCAKTLVRATQYMYNLENKLRYSKYVAPLMSCIEHGKYVYVQTRRLLCMKS